MPPLQLRDSRTGSEAKILPELGFNCFQFSGVVNGRRVEVIDSDPDFETGGTRPSASGIPLLFPFPNRIAAGQFAWEGRPYNLPLNKPPNAIHGFVFDRAWRVTFADSVTAVAEFQLSREAPDRMDLWPSDFVIQVKYALRGNALFSEITVRNPGDVPLPWGFGTHSYFRVPLSPTSSRGRCLIQVPAAQTWELRDSLPTGRRMPVTADRDLREGWELQDRQLDDVYTDLAKTGNSSASDSSPQWIQTVLMDAEAGIEVVQSFDTSFREVVAFTPPHGRSICMEPYTCVTNAVTLQQQGVDAGWNVLAPHSETRMWIAIEVGPVLA